MGKTWGKTGVKAKIKQFFPAFAYKHYRAYFIGQLISLIGSWLQTVAQGWLILQLTHSAFMVGLIAALGFLPVLLFSLFGGVLVDRFQKRKILILTQVFSMILALVLGGLTFFDLATVWVVALMAFLLGIVNAIDMPARQSFTIEIVGSEHLPSAIALNMGTFNTARVIGPAIAGILIATVGTGSAFILNGLSFLGPIIALMLMKVRSNIAPTHHHPLRSIKIGINYAKKHNYIKSLLIFTAISSIFGWSYATILPVMAEQTFHSNASGLGWLYSAAGVGSVLATIFISGFYKQSLKVPPENGFSSFAYKKFTADSLILSGSLIFAVSIILFALTSQILFALPILLLAGLGMSLQNAMVNSTIQNTTDHHLRGRVMSIFTLCMVGMQPFGSFQIGWLTQNYGSSFALALGGIIMLLNVMYLYFELQKTTRQNLQFAK